MKRYGNFYYKVYDIENIKTAILKASLGKRDRLHVKKILDNIDEYAFKVSNMLKNKAYKPSPYSTKIIIDGSSGKEREIFKPRFYPDQIIHWALIMQIQHMLMRGMYKYNCGSIPNRGSSLGAKAIKKWLRKDYKGTKYCLKLDIKKYYPSIDRDILKQKFRRIIKDKDCLWLIDAIIDSNNNGLPIGNYTSQWFANFFLQDVDHYIKENLGIKYYVRYVDDLVILESNKRKLHKDKEKLDKFLGKMNLQIKGNWQVFKVKDRGIDFLGFRFFYDKVILRKRIALRIKRRVNKINKKSAMSYKDACAVISYWGWIKRSNSYNFYNKYVKPRVSLAKARRVISNYAKTNKICNNTRNI